MKDYAPRINWNSPLLETLDKPVINGFVNKFMFNQFSKPNPIYYFMHTVKFYKGMLFKKLKNMRHRIYTMQWPDLSYIKGSTPCLKYQIS